MPIEVCNHDGGEQAGEWKTVEFPAKFRIGNWKVKLDLVSGGILAKFSDGDEEGKDKSRLCLYHFSDLGSLNEWMFNAHKGTSYPQYRNNEPPARRF